jgi:DNA-directed RNA polymerase subunit RPC12/RpoP
MNLLVDVIRLTENSRCTVCEEVLKKNTSHLQVGDNFFCEFCGVHILYELRSIISKILDTLEVRNRAINACIRKQWPKTDPNEDTDRFPNPSPRL